MSTTILQPLLAATRKEPGLSPIQAFRSDERGVVAMIFGLLIIPLMMLIGLSVDFARWVQLRNESQSVVDSMALAAGRAAQMGTQASAMTAASNYFAAAKPNTLLGANYSITPKNGSTSFDIVVTGWMRTPFMSVANVGRGSSGSAGSAAAGCPANNGFACMKVEAKATSVLAAGGNNGSNVEVSMMLDITGSMGPGYGNGQKLADLKTAAKEAVDILVWSDQSKYTSKIALAPFSQRVNAGQYAPAITGQNPTKNGKLLIPCVTERIGSDKYKDTAPASGRWIGRFDPGSSSGNSAQYDNDGDAVQGDCGNSDPKNNAKVLPLTKDKTLLTSHIDGLEPRGGTAGHLGTAWAWYTLSPNWNTIWPSSAAGSYSDLTTYNTNGAPKLRKIAVLMTDGEYNQWYSSSDDSKTQAAALCTAMKTAKIEIYTIGFQIDNNAAKTLLQNCATDTSHYYDASTGEALKQAFRDIALKISSLRLSQ
jgi:Flp pilus assembly protein TadG